MNKKDVKTLSMREKIKISRHEAKKEYGFDLVDRKTKKERRKDNIKLILTVTAGLVFLIIFPIYFFLHNGLILAIIYSLIGRTIGGIIMNLIGDL